MKNGLVEWKGVKVETLRRLGISLLTALVIFLFCIFAPPQTEAVLTRSAWSLPCLRSHFFFAASRSVLT